MSRRVMSLFIRKTPFLTTSVGNPGAASAVPPKAGQELSVLAESIVAA
jgi:hypothetical protein